MRDLQTFELTFVSGAGGCYTPPPPPPPCSCDCPSPGKRKNKGNNGYGNGGGDGVPGNSGKTGGGKAEDIYR